MEEKIETPINEDAELDKELNATLEEVKAGKELQPTVDVKPEEPKTPEVEEPSKPQEEGEVKKEEYDYRIPNKGKFESDESYEKRIELMDLVKKRKLAGTEEQRQIISDQIKTTKGQLKNLNGTDKINNQLNKEVEVPIEEDENVKADRERLKELGGATKEDIQKMIQEERKSIEVNSTLNTFIQRHPELADEDVREVYFDFVESNFNWQGKSGKDLMTTLELAHESMFKPSESIQERVLKGANVAEKVNAMQFPGGTVSKQAISADMQKSVNELKGTGMSEEKALELLSE